MVTRSTRGSLTMGVKGLISAAGCRVAPQLPRNRRRRPAQLVGDRPQAQPEAAQIGDLDAFVLGQIARADLADRQAIQWRDEPDLDAIAVGLIAACPVRRRRP